MVTLQGYPHYIMISWNGGSSYAVRLGQVVMTIECDYYIIIRSNNGKFITLLLCQMWDYCLLRC